MAEETYQDDLRYERAVWPEKFVDGGADTQPEAEWRERVLLALQGIDISLEKLCGTGQSDSDKNLAELIEARGKLDE